MSDAISLAAEPRDRAGKGVARATRRNGRVPGVIYGGKEPPVLISVDRAVLTRQFANGTFFTHVFDVSVGDATHRVLPRDVQLDPVTDIPVHIDFLRVGKDSAVVVEVPVEFINAERSPGIKRGGVLNVVRHTIEMRCPVDSIPEHITIDLSGFDVGASIHISHVTLPAGVVPTITDRDFTVATIAAPSALRGKEDTAGPADAGTTPAA